MLVFEEWWYYLFGFGFGSLYYVSGEVLLIESEVECVVGVYVGEKWVIGVDFEL